jgi:hypothetical protein
VLLRDGGDLANLLPTCFLPHAEENYFLELIISKQTGISASFPNLTKEFPCITEPLPDMGRTFPKPWQRFRDMGKSFLKP